MIFRMLITFYGANPVDSVRIIRPELRAMVDSI